MSRFKRFSIPKSYYKDGGFDDTTVFKEVKPIFGKDGHYFDRELNTEWYEFKGKAYTSIETDGFTAKDYIYLAELYETKVRDCDFADLGRLAKEYNPPLLKEFYETEADRRTLRNIRKGVKLMIKKAK